MPPKATNWGDASASIPERLTRVANAIAAGILVEGAVAEQLRREIIFGQAAPPPAPPAAATPLETEERFRERQAGELAKTWVGTPTLPWLCQDILDAMGATTDPLLESDLKHITASNRYKRMIFDMFRRAGAGVTPTCLTAPTSPDDIRQLQQIALATCREQLRRVASAYAAHVASKSQGGMPPPRRKRCRDEFYNSMEDGDTARQGQLVVAIAAKAADTANALERKLSPKPSSTSTRRSFKRFRMSKEKKHVAKGGKRTLKNTKQQQQH